VIAPLEKEDWKIEGSSRERLWDYATACFIAGTDNRNDRVARRAGYRIVDPAKYRLEPALYDQISRDYDGLLHSMQGIAEFMPKSYERKTRELLQLHDLERKRIAEVRDRIEQRGCRIFTVPVRPAPQPAPKPKRVIPPSLAYLMVDIDLLRLTSYNDPLARLAKPDRALEDLATPEMINRHFRKRNGGT
jgi:hypothetical protein